MTDYLDRTVDYNDPTIASIFDELSFWSARFGMLLFQHLELVGGISVLDVGFGNGFPIFELAHVHGPSCKFVGVDIWKAALSRAALKRDAYNLPNVTLVMADGAHLPLPDAHFDLIVSNLGLNNFEYPQAALAECARVARSKARLVLTTNIKGHMQEFYDVYRQTLIDLGKSHHLERLTANEDHRGTRESVCDLLENAGFRVARAIEDKFHLRFLNGSALMRHSLIRIGFLGQWRAIVDPDEEREVLSTLEQRLNEMARQQGEVRLTIPMLYVEGRKN